MRSRIWLMVLAFALVGGALVFGMSGGGAEAATPPSGTVTTTTPAPPWTGLVTGGAGADESTCVEGVNCDTYLLTVGGMAADWAAAGKLVDIKITWTVPANDYDLYVHKCPAIPTVVTCNAGTLVGNSGNGAPSTQEETTLDPSSPGTPPQTYSVHVVDFTVSPGDPYHGTATPQLKPASRTATYVSGGITFSPSVTVKAPVVPRDGEPSSRTDSAGNFYVSAIRGVPAGVDLWYDNLNPADAGYDAYMRNWVYRGQPDAPGCTGTPTFCLGADGGGDVDLAVGRPDPATGVNNNPPTLAYSSLVAANISTGKSTDKGLSYQLNPVGNVAGVPVDDRQWLEALGPNTVYLYYRTIAPTVSMIQRSDDGGFTYGAAKTAGAIGQAGYIDVHQKTGAVYVSGSTGQVCTGIPALPTGEPLTYACHMATPGSNVAHIFFPVKVADDGTANGTVYVVWSDDHDVFLAHSLDQGTTWSQAVQVNDPASTPKTNIFPWLETGPTPGSVGVVWYGTTDTANDDNANWRVYYSTTYDATAAAPTFRQVEAGDHVIHGSNISEGGLTGTANRNLIDYFQVSFAPNGSAVIAYADDHNDFDGHTYAVHQLTGPALNAAKTPLPPPPPAPAAQTGPYPYAADVGGIAGSQVTDFKDDVADALLVRQLTDDPLDILSIKYSCEGGGLTPPNPQVVATMKVSQLLVAPPDHTWRMSFTANAPDSTLSPTGDYSFGVSDRGDQFYVQAATNVAGTPAYTYGTAVRNSDGSIAYTSKGTATSGAIDPATQTITVKVALSALNPLVTHGGALANGSVLVGLRGQAFTGGANVKRDVTRGGTQYALACGGPTAVQVRAFGASAAKGIVRLTWRTASESRVLGYHVWRVRSGRAVRVDRALIAARQAGRVGGAVYRLVDRGARAGVRYTYRLQVVGQTGARFFAATTSVRAR